MFFQATISTFESTMFYTRLYVRKNNRLNISILPKQVAHLWEVHVPLGRPLGHNWSDHYSIGPQKLIVHIPGCNVAWEDIVQRSDHTPTVHVRLRNKVSVTSKWSSYDNNFRYNKIC